jgi:hypothetical protein
MRSTTVSVACLATLLAGAQAHAWTILPGGATDESVCDMGRSTTERISRRQWIPPSSPRHNEIYVRYIVVRILENCKDGQQLILGSPGDVQSLDEPVLSEVAKTFCKVSEIQWSAVPTKSESTGEMRPGFELKCQISKSTQANEAHQAREREKTTEAVLIEEQQKDVALRAPREQGGDASGRWLDKTLTKEGCGKLGWGAIFGGGGNCAP